MKLSSKLDAKILNKIAKAQLDGKLDLSGEELLYATLFIVGSHVRRKTSDLTDLIRRYGKSDQPTKLARHLGKSLFDDVAKKDRMAIRLFWKLLKNMNNNLLTESLNEDLNGEKVFLESLNENA